MDTGFVMQGFDWLAIVVAVLVIVKVLVDQ